MKGNNKILQTNEQDCEIEIKSSCEIMNIICYVLTQMQLIQFNFNL